MKQSIINEVTFTETDSLHKLQIEESKPIYFCHIDNYELKEFIKIVTGNLNPSKIIFKGIDINNAPTIFISNELICEFKYKIANLDNKLSVEHWKITFTNNADFFCALKDYLKINDEDKVDVCIMKLIKENK